MYQKMVVATDRKDWLELRRNYIGGSDIAPLMLSKELRPKWMSTPIEVWLDKTGQAAEKADNAAMRRGRAMEDPTAQRYAARYGFSVQSCPTLIEGHFAANIDRIVAMKDAPAVSEDGTKIICKRLLECKTASSAWGENSPIYYYAQPQWYMGFLDGCESADIACWFGDRVQNIKEDEEETDFAVYHHERNQDFIDQARERAEEFMQKYVIPRVMPPVESEGEARLKWAVSNDSLDAVIASEEIAKAVAEIHRIDEETENLKFAREAKVAEVMKAMAEHPILKGGNGEVLVRWKSQKARETVDWKGLCEKYCKPKDEWVNEFTKIGNPSRPFKVL